MIITDLFVAWLNVAEDTAFGIEQGAIIGLIFGLGVLLIWLLPKYKWIAAAILLLLITPLATGGYWFSTGEWGINDWDYYFSLHTGHRNTILEYNQLPHWNPYICGGTAGIADPEFRFFTPTFLLQLIFGIPVGFRLAAFLATATGAIGMLMLGKRLRLSVYGALLAAIVVAFSSVNLLEITEGHPNIFSAMFVPWIFWSWLSAYKQKTSKIWPIVCGAFLALTFFQGGIYLLMYTTIAFIGLLIIAPDRKAALKTSVISGLWALGFAAIKLIPVLLWLRQFQDEHYVSSTYILPYLDKVLLGRYLHGAGDLLPGQLSGWHEYGAYVGPVALLLSFFGLLKDPKRRIIWTLAVTAIVGILIASSGPVLEPYFDKAPFLPRSNISRFMLFAIVPLSLLSGFGIDYLARHKKKALQLAGIAVIALAAVDLMSLSYPLSEQAFILPAVSPLPEQGPDPIGYNSFRYQFTHFPSAEARRKGYQVEYPRAYAATLAGYGTMSYCSVLTPPRAVQTIHDEGEQTYISLESEGQPVNGSYEVISWTPNKVVANVSAEKAATLFLNANYAKGWTINNEPAVERGNRVATTIPAGDHTLTFEYKTRGFREGVLITITTLAAAIFVIRRWKKSEGSDSVS